MTGRQVCLAVAIVLGALVAAATSSGADGTQRQLPYNTQVNRTDDFVCTYNIIHGNYIGAYLNKRIASNNCDFIDVQVTGCSGLACPDGPLASTTSKYQWISSQLPSGYNIIYSHDFTLTPNVGVFQWHNTL